MSERICTICNLPITEDQSFIGTGAGDGNSFGHPDCYWRREAAMSTDRIAQLERERDELHKKWEAMHGGHEPEVGGCEECPLCLLESRCERLKKALEEIGILAITGCTQKHFNDINDIAKAALKEGE